MITWPSLASQRRSVVTSVRTVSVEKIITRKNFVVARHMSDCSLVFREFEINFTLKSSEESWECVQSDSSSTPCSTRSILVNWWQFVFEYFNRLFTEAVFWTVVWSVFRSLLKLFEVWCLGFLSSSWSIVTEVQSEILGRSNAALSDCRDWQLWLVFTLYYY